MTSFSKVGDPPLLIYGRTTLYAPKYGNGTKKVWLSKKAIKVAHSRSSSQFFMVRHKTSLQMLLLFFFMCICMKYCRSISNTNKLVQNFGMDKNELLAEEFIGLYSCHFSNVKSRSFRKDVTATFYNGRHLLPYGFWRKTFLLKQFFI